MFSSGEGDGGIEGQFYFRIGERDRNVSPNFLFGGMVGQW